MGFCYGSVLSLIAYETVKYYGIKNFGGNYGLVYTAWGFAGFLGSLIAGRVVDLTGKYLMAYLISAGLLIVTFLLASV